MTNEDTPPTTPPTHTHDRGPAENACDCGGCSTCERDTEQRGSFTTVDRDTKLDRKQLEVVLSALHRDVEAAVGDIIKAAPTVIVGVEKLQQLELAPEGATTTLGELSNAVRDGFKDAPSFAAAMASTVLGIMLRAEVATAIKVSKDGKKACVELVFSLPEEAQAPAKDAPVQAELPLG